MATDYYGVLGLAALLIGGFIVSPVFVGNGMVDWQAGPFEIRGTGPAVLLAVVGLLLVIPLVYLIGLLAAGQGTPVLLRVEGDDEAEAAEAVAGLFARCFDEDD